LYLMMTGRYLPRAVAAFGLFASILWLAADQVRIGAPAAAAYVAFSDPPFLLAETLAGIWLLTAPQVRLKPDPTYDVTDTTPLR